MKVAENAFAQAWVVAQTIHKELGKNVVVSHKRGLYSVHIVSESCMSWHDRIAVTRRKWKPLFASGFGRRFTHRRRKLGGN